MKSTISGPIIFAALIQLSAVLADNSASIGTACDPTSGELAEWQDTRTAPYTQDIVFSAWCSKDGSPWTKEDSAAVASWINATAVTGTSSANPAQPTKPVPKPWLWPLGDCVSWTNGALTAAKDGDFDTKGTWGANNCTIDTGFVLTCASQPNSTQAQLATLNLSSVLSVQYYSDGKYPTISCPQLT